MFRKIFITVIVFFVSAVAQTQDYFQQDVAYTIAITLDPNSYTYTGTETIVYTNNSPDTLTYIWLHLYPNAYKDQTTPYAKQQEFERNREFHFSKPADRGYININSAQCADQNMEWHFKKDAIDEAQFILPEALIPGESVIINLEFEARFPIVFSRSGHHQNAYFQGTQWYPKVVVYDKYGWHPDSYLSTGEFYGDFGTFDVSVTLPYNYVIDATGVLQPNPQEEAFIDSIVAYTKGIVSLQDKAKRDQAWKEWKRNQRDKTHFDSLKTVRFIAQNVHDFAWFAGVDYMIHQELTADSVLARVCVLPENVYDWRHVPDYIVQTLNFYGKKVGPYKYPKAVVIDGSQISSGGMEYPMITLITMDYQNWNNLLENVIVHEVGHNWCQGMLGSNERANVFLDEGINSFYDGLYLTHYHGEQGLTKFDSLLGDYNVLDDLGDWHYHTILYALQVSRGLDLPMNLRGEQYDRRNYSVVNYSKGVFMLRALRWTMGQDRFDKAMHQYFKRWCFKHPELDDFWNVMQEFSDMDLTDFRKEWMETTHFSDLKISDYETEKEAGGYKTEIFIKNVGTMKNLPAPVDLVTENNDTLEGRWNGIDDEPVVIHHKSPVKKLEVNLKRTIFELNYLNNNSYLPDFEFTFLRPIPSFDTYKVSFYPLLGYEYFVDGVRLGAGFWAGNILTYQYFLTGNFYIGTESGTPGYKLNLTHRVPGFLANYSDLYIGIHDKDGFKGINASIEIVSIDPHDTSIQYHLLLGIDDSRLYDMDYHEKNLYQKNRYSTVKVDFTTKFRKMLWRDDLRFAIEKTVNLFDSKTDYLKYELSNTYRYFLSASSNILWDFYLGHVQGDNIAAQELIYAGGDIDPKHQYDVPGYRGSIAPLRSFTLNRGMQMLGYAHVDRIFLKNKSGYASGLTFDLPYIPLIYARMASLFEDPGDFADNDPFYEAGFKLGNEYFSMIFPVYISDPLENEDHIDFRFFFSYKFPFD